MLEHAAEARTWNLYKYILALKVVVGPLLVEIDQWTV